MEQIITTKEAIQAAFTLWMKRYLEDPEGFEKNYFEASSYGEAVTPYFLSILNEVNKEIK